jgi:hypothetical protein
MLKYSWDSFVSKVPIDYFLYKKVLIYGGGKLMSPILETENKIMGGENIFVFFK